MNPLLIMALLAAASQAANYAGQRKVDNTRANAMNEESRRRKQAEASAAQSAQSTTELLTNAGKNQDAKAAELEAQYAAHAPPPGGTPGLSTSFTAPARSTLTVAAGDKVRAKGKAETDALAKAKAGLNAYGDVMADAQIGANKNLTDINQQNTGVRNWAQYVMPAQMARANEAGKDWGTLADALQIASAIYGPIGLSKGVGTGLKTAYDVSTTSGAGGSGIAGLYNV